MYPPFGTHRLFHHRRSLFFLFTRRTKIERSVPKRPHIKFGRQGITQKKEYGKPYECWCFSCLWCWLLSSASSSQDTVLFCESLLANIMVLLDVTLRSWISCFGRFELTCRLRLQGCMVMSRQTEIRDWTAVRTADLTSLFHYFLRQLKSEFFFFASGLLFKLVRHTAVSHAVSWLLWWKCRTVVFGSGRGNM